jgi:hypothetical protein
MLSATGREPRNSKKWSSREFFQTFLRVLKTFSTARLQNLTSRDSGKSAVAVGHSKEFGRELVASADVLEREQSCDGLEDVHRVVLGETLYLAGRVVADQPVAGLQEQPQQRLVATEHAVVDLVSS